MNIAKAFLVVICFLIALAIIIAITFSTTSDRHSNYDYRFDGAEGYVAK